MKLPATLIILISIVFSITVLAQPQQATEYDFWVGEWTVSWKNKDGTNILGTNKIEKTLDGKVLQEYFHDPSTNFKGTSLSVFDPKTKLWHQAWADNQGGYYNFIGETIENRKIFKTPPVTTNETVYIQRMVFYNITNNSMTWDWESTTDGGKNWTLNWRVEYARKK